MKGVDDVHMKFEFYVLNYNHNKQKIEMYNIFNNIRVQESIEKTIEEYLKNPKSSQYKSGFDDLVKEIDSIIAWQEYGRFEYECSCGYAFETDCSKLEKIDCYYQAHANIKTITHEVLRQYKEQLEKGEDN